MPIIAAAPTSLGKLQELILCLAERAPNIGITKLEKLLYLCDFEASKVLGRPITGDTYRNFQWGPVPKHFIPALEQLLEAKMERREIRLESGKKFIELKPKEKCQEKSFSSEEWVIINNVLREYGGKTAAELVLLTHKELTWKLTKRNEEIPYFLAHYRTHVKLSPRELDVLMRDPDYLESIARQLTPAAAR